MIVEFHNCTKSKKRTRKSYSPYQIFYLEKYFQVNKYPNNTQKRLLANELDISELRVKTWFQNRRQKMKKCLEKDAAFNSGDDLVIEETKIQTVPWINSSACEYIC